MCVLAPCVLHTLGEPVALHVCMAAWCVRHPPCACVDPDEVLVKTSVYCL